jgi:hypothetical protein
MTEWQVGRYGEEKLAALRGEAAERRALPKGAWRARAAQLLRRGAAWLEPTPVPVTRPHAP